MIIEFQSVIFETHMALFNELTKVSCLKQLTFSIQSSEVIGKWFSVCFPACVSDKNKTSKFSESIFRFFFDGGSNNPFSCTRFCWDELFNFLKIDFLKSSENGTKGSNQCDIISLVIACKSKKYDINRHTHVNFENDAEELWI